MDVSYERSGGIAGDHASLQLSGGSGAATDRRAGRRPLTLDERQRRELDELAGRAAAAPPPAPTGQAAVADGYRFKVAVGAASATFHRLGARFGPGDGTPWAALAAFLDRLLDAALGPRRREPLDESLLE